MGRELCARVAEYASTRGLFRRGSILCAAVSGGLDSVVLLDLLTELRPRFGYELRVATVDHGLRVGSASDAVFVRKLALGRGLRCDLVRISVQGGRGWEDEARRQRMAFLRSLPVDQVALAHHRDDQAETLLLRALRGGGLEALSGMAPRSDPFVRPLLSESRDELERWARQRGLAWREDPTNENSDRERNFLRKRVIPLLGEIRGGIPGNLASLTDRLRDDSVLIKEGTERSWHELGQGRPVGMPPWMHGLDRARLGEMPQAMSSRMLRRLVALTLGEEHLPSSSTVERALRLLGGSRLDVALELHAGWRLCFDERLRCLPPLPEPMALLSRGPRLWGLHQIWLESPPPSPDRLQLMTSRDARAAHGEALIGLGERMRLRGIPASFRPYHPILLQRSGALLPLGLSSPSSPIGLRVKGPGLGPCGGGIGCVAV